MDGAMSAGSTRCNVKCTLAAGTTTTISNTGTISYSVKGKACTKSAMTNAATPTTDAKTGAAFPALTANKGTVVIIGLDASGNVKACQGSIEDLDATGAFIYAPQLPLVPKSICPIGYIVLKAGSTLVGTWTFGTNNLSSVTGMTYTFGDLNDLPNRPIVA